MSSSEDRSHSPRPDSPSGSTRTCRRCSRRGCCRASSWCCQGGSRSPVGHDRDYIFPLLLQQVSIKIHLKLCLKLLFLSETFRKTFGVHSPGRRQSSCCRRRTRSAGRRSPVRRRRCRTCRCRGRCTAPRSRCSP